jgi:hypothetical protein
MAGSPALLALRPVLLALAGAAQTAVGSGTKVLMSVAIVAADAEAVVAVLGGRGLGFAGHGRNEVQGRGVVAGCRGGVEKTSQYRS